MYIYIYIYLLSPSWGGKDNQQANNQRRDSWRWRQRTLGHVERGERNIVNISPLFLVLTHHHRVRCFFGGNEIILNLYHYHIYPHLLNPHSPCLFLVIILPSITCVVINQWKLDPYHAPSIYFMESGSWDFFHNSLQGCLSSMFSCIILSLFQSTHFSKTHGLNP